MSTPASALVQDKDFIAAPIQEKIGYLSHIDPDFAKAHPDDQQRYIQHIVSPPPSQPTQFEKERAPENQRGFIGTVADKAAGAWQSMKSSADPTGGFPLSDRRAWIGMESHKPPMLEQAQRPLPKDLDNPLYRTATTLSPLVPFLNPEASERASNIGDIGAVAAEAAVPTAAALAPAATRGIGRATAPIVGKIGRSMYTPAGELTPGAEALAHPTKIGEYIARKVVPEPAEQVAKREMGITYEKRGEDLMRRGEEQTNIDTANEARLRGVESARQKELASTERLREQHARSMVPQKGISPRPSRGITMTAEMPERQAAIPRSIGTPTPGQELAVRQSEAPSIGGKGKIAEPGSPPPDFKATLVSYERPDLVKMVRDPQTPYANRVAAIRELRRNPGNVPKEVLDNLTRYMVEPGAKIKIYGGPTK
jgi:hypothetical protein